MRNGAINPLEVDSDSGTKTVNVSIIGTPTLFGVSSLPAVGLRVMANRGLGR